MLVFLNVFVWQPDPFSFSRNPVNMYMQRNNNSSVYRFDVVFVGISLKMPIKSSFKISCFTIYNHHHNVPGCTESKPKRKIKIVTIQKVNYKWDTYVLCVVQFFPSFRHSCEYSIPPIIIIVIIEWRVRWTMKFREQRIGDQCMMHALQHEI